MVQTLKDENVKEYDIYDWYVVGSIIVMVVLAIIIILLLFTKTAEAIPLSVIENCTAYGCYVK